MIKNLRTVMLIDKIVGVQSERFYLCIEND